MLLLKTQQNRECYIALGGFPAVSAAGSEPGQSDELDLKNLKIGRVSSQKLALRIMKG